MKVKFLDYNNESKQFNLRIGKNKIKRKEIRQVVEKKKGVPTMLRKLNKLKKRSKKYFTLSHLK